MEPFEMVPALSEKDLDVLRTVKIVTGFVVLDGGDSEGNHYNMSEFIRFQQTSIFLVR